MAIILNKDGEKWCGACGTVFEKDGTTVKREGRVPHGTVKPKQKQKNPELAVC